MPAEIKLPELGENVETGDVLRVLVNPGDHIQKDQSLLELETDKATFEVPSSAAGVVKEIRVKAGDKVKVGQSLLLVEEGEAAPAAAAPPAAPQAEGRAEAAPKPSPAPAAATTPAEPEAPPRRRAEVVEMTRAPKAPAEVSPAAERAALVAAAPATRRLARELGINIQDVQGTGPGGRISMDDVTAFARRLLAPGGSRAAAPLPDFTAWGAVERKPMSGVRRATARRLSQAWATVPHVVQHDRADITALEALRTRLSKKIEGQGGRPLTLTAFAVQVCAAALKKFPQFNSSVDLQAEELILKQYVHIGVAVDTDRGLLVPVIRDADRKRLFDLASELTTLAEKARSRTLSPDEMQGGTFTVSNLGGIGGTAFSPIVNWPEVAILGISRASIQPVHVDGRFEPRLLMPLSLSYDHRAIDGADGIRFLRWVAEALEQPALLWLDN